MTSRLLTFVWCAYSNPNENRQAFVAIVLGRLAVQPCGGNSCELFHYLLPSESSSEISNTREIGNQPSACVTTKSHLSSLYNVVLDSGSYLEPDLRTACGSDPSIVGQSTL